MKKFSIFMAALFGFSAMVMADNLVQNGEFEKLDKKMRESEAGSIMHEGRHMYMSVNDRCGPPYTIVFDDDYEKLCSWADVIKSGKVWPDELADAAVELFEPEKNDRELKKEE